MFSPTSSLPPTTVIPTSSNNTVPPSPSTTNIIIRKPSSPTTHSPSDDAYLVQKARDPRFFYLEPGLGVILLGMIINPHEYRRLILWAIFTSAGTALVSFRHPIAKISSFLSVLTALIYAPGSHRLVKFTFKMATLMRLLRVVEALFDPEYFEQRGAKFAVKFAFLYHDLRRASRFDTIEEQQQAFRTAMIDTTTSLSTLATSLAILQHYPNLSLPARTVLSVIRFYSVVVLVEAAYRTHLALFEIKAPLCFDAPWKSQTIAEFWGRRWNLAIARQMRNVAYKPLASQGLKQGAEFAVFSASALLHMFPIVILGGSRQAQLSTLAYFCVQPVIMAVERALGLRGMAWVQLAGWTSAPLFALPLLEVL